MNARLHDSSGTCLDYKLLLNYYNKSLPGLGFFLYSTSFSNTFPADSLLHRLSLAFLWVPSGIVKKK